MISAIYFDQECKTPINWQDLIYMYNSSDHTSIDIKKANMISYTKLTIWMIWSYLSSLMLIWSQLWFFNSSCHSSSVQTTRNFYKLKFHFLHTCWRIHNSSITHYNAIATVSACKIKESLFYLKYGFHYVGLKLLHLLSI